MDKYFDEFMNMYHSNMIENKNSMNAIKDRLVKNYNKNNNTPIVRAFKVYYQLKQQIENMNPVEEVREEVLEEVKEEEKQIANDESSEEEEEITYDELDFTPDENGDEPQLSKFRKPINVKASEKEIAAFTKKDFIKTEEYKWCIENDNLPFWVKEAIDSREKHHFWQGVHYNLKTHIDRLKQ